MFYVLLALFGFMVSICHANDNDASSDAWFNQLNDDLRVIYQYTAHFAWELSVNPNQELAQDSKKFNAFKTSWANIKCAEANGMLSTAYGSPLKSDISNISLLESTTEKLCFGPKFTEYQMTELSTYLYQMQTVFTETQVCLPTHFDVCKNLDRIWEFTYVRCTMTNEDSFEPLDLSKVLPQNLHRMRPSELSFFNGANVSDELDFKVTEPNDLSEEFIAKAIRSQSMICLDGESDLNRITSGDFSTLQRPDCAFRFNEVFRWAWESWRAAVGERIGQIYPYAIQVMNAGARANGFYDIGDVWRRETELPDLLETMGSLMKQIRPFYELLHGVLRRVLWKRVQSFEPFEPDGTIPAHILGSMWSQNWQLYQKLMLPFEHVDLDSKMNQLNWTSIDLVKRADDFYRSLSLPPMTNEFWTRSIFEKNGESVKCHGTAANMFQTNDYRMIACAEATLEDFYVIVHEMGHLQYYMAFADQPTIYQDGNAAIQESIGDAIFMAMMAPQHLNRLQLLSDKRLFAGKSPKLSPSLLKSTYSTPVNITRSKKTHSRRNQHQSASKIVTVSGARFPSHAQLNAEASQKERGAFRNKTTVSVFDLVLLLRTALSKIPQIPFQYLMDIFRWNLFNETISMDNANAAFWKLAVDEQGIHPPDWENRKHFFDAGAKFHVADNTPYVRYFLASFIQAQIFKGMCDVTVYGSVNPNKTLPMPLHRCDIYGSKRAGKLLKKALKLGTSVHWTEVLYILTGSRKVSSEALLLYYKPLIEWLEKLVIDHNIPLGWPKSRNIRDFQM